MLRTTLTGWRSAVAAALVAVAGMAPASAAEVVLEPVADASIFLGGDPVVLAEGSGEYLWSLSTGGGLMRRMLIRFDLGVVPVGSTIRSVELSLYESTPRPRDNPSLFLHRLQASWTEGPANAGSAGSGAPAAATDVTWLHRSYPGLFWSAPGGDFVPGASASAVVGNPGSRARWLSTPTLVQDVQSWVDGTAANQGWIIIGSPADEAASLNAKRFESRHTGAPANRPQLRVTYDPPDAEVPLPAWALLLLVAALGWGLRSAQRGSRQ